MLARVIEARRKSLGGFEVGRVLPAPACRMIGPFVFFDHLGPLDMPQGVSRDVDVRSHPHIGLSTVTYLFSGEMMHRDSLDAVQPIRPGEVNWMVAGRGVTHAERFERARAMGDHLHGIQAWVALPERDEETTPSFAHHAGDDLPTWNDAGVRGRLIAGEAFGLVARVKTHSPLFYAHLDLDSGARAALPEGHRERALYVASGAVEVDGTHYAAGAMLAFSPGSADFRATESSTVMLLGGEPLGERYLFWNFVSSSRERLEQAKADWRAGRFVLPATDRDEFIPLPAEPALPPDPLS